MEKQKCPEVRFNSFTKDWEQSYFLDNIQNIIDYRGRTPKKLGMDWSKSGYLALSALNVKNGYIDPRIDAHYGDEKLYQKWMSGNELRKGQVLFTTEAPMGNVAQVPDDTGYILSQRTIAFNTEKNKISDNFLAVLLGSPNVFNRLSELCSGGTAKGVSQKSLSTLEVIFPTELNEQECIGNFFQNLDKSIALQEKKLSQTQNLKKAMLEKMFPKVGSKQPEIRLKGFSGDWDTIRLGSLCSIGDIDHRMPESTKSGIPYLMTGDFFGINGLDFENAKLISNEDYEQLSKKIKPEIGDILFARYASVGTVRLVVTDVKFLISYSCAILKTSVNSKGEYLFYWFQNSFAQNQIEQEINTGSQRNIGIDSLKKLSVILPKTNEQKAIAYFFKSLDETLALQQQQLQTLKNLKQSFLEKMFV